MDTIEFCLTTNELFKYGEVKRSISAFELTPPHIFFIRFGCVTLAICWKQLIEYVYVSKVDRSERILKQIFQFTNCTPAA